jgi:hypothetical protein
MTMDLYSLGGLGGLLIGAVVVAALIFCIAMGVDDPQDFSGFLRRRQIKGDAAPGFDRLDAVRTSRYESQVGNGARPLPMAAKSVEREEVRATLER